MRWSQSVIAKLVIYSVKGSVALFNSSFGYTFSVYISTIIPWLQNSIGLRISLFVICSPMYTSGLLFTTLSASIALVSNYLYTGEKKARE